MTEEDIREIVFPVKDMKKYSIRVSLIMILSGIAVCWMVRRYAEVYHTISVKMAMGAYVLLLISLGGVFCLMYSIYNSSRVVNTILMEKDVLKINDDVFSYGDLVEVAFDWGRFLGNVSRFNSIYLVVSTNDVKRKYWLGLDSDRNAFPAKEKLCAVIDQLEERYKINR